MSAGQRVSQAARGAAKKAAAAVGRGSGRAIKKTVKWGYAAGSKRDRRRTK